MTTSTLKHMTGNGIRQTVAALLSLILLLSMLPSAKAAVGQEEASLALFEQLKQGKRAVVEKNYETPEKPTVYLTFDDGPSKLTPEVLDILKHEKVPATFFVLGEQVEARPDLIQRMVKEGHALGNHSYNHVYSELYAGFGNYWLQLQKTEAAVEKAAGVKPLLVRAPGGTHSNYDAFYFYYLEQAGYEVHDWNIDSEDARRAGMSADEIYAAVAKGPFRHEAIVLMHDSGGHGETVKALPRIIKLFKEKGYAFAPLTPEVKPVQFSTGKKRWPRSIDAGTYQHQLAMVREHGEKLAAGKGIAAGAGVLEGMPASQGKPASEGGAAEAPATGSESGGKPFIKQLKLQLGGQMMLLGGDHYLLESQRIEVPLRQLTETLGGQVEWSEEQRTASVRFGRYVAEYDLSRRELRVTRPAAGFLGFGMQTQKVTLPEMDVREGTIMVPLKKTLELLGYQVRGYESGIKDNEASVSVALHGSFGVRWGKSMPTAPELPSDKGFVREGTTEYAASNFLY